MTSSPVPSPHSPKGTTLRMAWVRFKAWWANQSSGPVCEHCKGRHRGDWADLGFLLCLDQQRREMDAKHQKFIDQFGPKSLFDGTRR